MANTQIQRYDPATVESIRRLAQMMDGAFRVPGTNFRFGADALLGLIPGVGDLTGMLFSIYIIVKAQEIGVPQKTIYKMSANTIIDGLVGTIPILGDIFDFYFKANKRNLRLMGIETW